MKKIMAICVLVLMGCGTINKDKLWSKKTKGETITKEITENLAVQQAINFRDSTNNVMELTIWPKGPFTFSSASGFAGEAFKMEWKGKQSSEVELSNFTSANSRATTRLKQEKQRVAKLKKKQVEWEGMSYGAWLLLAVLVVGGVWLWRKRLKTV